MRDQEILGLSESYNQVIANEIELEEKSGSPRPTFMPRSRERDIGKHDDWKDKPAEEWDDETSEEKKAGKLRRRLNAVVSTQRRQDTETNVREEVLSYLLDEGFASDEKSAEAIMDAMSEAWIVSIVDEGFKKMNRGKIERQAQRLGGDKATVLRTLANWRDTPEWRKHSTSQARKNRAGGSGSEYRKGKELQARDDAKADIKKYGFH